MSKLGHLYQSVCCSVVETALLVNVTPPAVYPVPDISFAVEYAVVPAPKFALLVYNAIFKVSVTKSCPI